MSGIETILSVIGTAAGVAQSIAQGQAQAQQARYSAANLNQQARNDIDSANAEANKLRRRGELAAGAARAGVAGSGLLLDGSPGDAIAQGAAAANLDALNALWRGQLQAGQLRAQAQAAKAQGQTALRNGYFGAGSSLLNGAGSLAKGLTYPAPLRAGTAAAARGLGQGLLGAEDYDTVPPYIRYGI